MEIVEKICPKKKQEFAKVCLACISGMANRGQTDIQRQLEDTGVTFDYFPLACDENTDAPATAKLIY